MSKFFIPANNPEDWKQLLAEPDKQWKTGYSAKSLAYCWQKTNDFPRSIKRVFVCDAKGLSGGDVLGSKHMHTKSQ